MKIVVQNVLEAKCVINEAVYSQINEGFCLFVSFTEGDDEKIIQKMTDKLLKLRVFADSEGKTNLNLEQISGEILSIS